jgi:hypothetical protein
MMTPLCVYCRHESDDEDATVNACAAFPKGIPGKIQTSQFDHRLPHPGDHGIQFEPKDPDWQIRPVLDEMLRKARTKQESVHA